MFKKLVNKKGFTLVELLIVMAVVAILVAIIIPSFKGMQEEGWITKAEQELQTLQTAVESYYRHHNNSYPPDIHASLLAAQPQIIYKKLEDPWKTDATNSTYGYLTGNSTTFGDWYIVYSQSIGKETNITWDVATSAVSKNTTTGDADIAVSNAPINF